MGVNARTRAADAARGRIICAARARFASVGFEGASTRQIAEEAGVAQSLLLYHFTSKESLWKAVMDDLFFPARARLDEAERASREATIPERLMAVARLLVQLAAEQPDIHRLMTIEGRSESGRLRWLVERHLRPVHEKYIAWIRRGQRARLVRSGDPILLYYSILAIAGTTYSLAPEIKLLTGTTSPPAPAAVEALIRSLLHVETEAP